MHAIHLEAGIATGDGRIFELSETLFVPAGAYYLRAS